MSPPRGLEPSRERSLTIRSGAVRLRASSYGAGPAIVLLHAGLEKRAVWRPVASGLARAGYHVTAVDQRGHGDSDRTARYRLDDFAGDAAQVIAHLAPRRPVLVGASLGGFAALTAAAGDQARVAGLVLIDVVAAPDPVRTRTHLAPLIAHVPADQDRAMCIELVDDILLHTTPLRNAAAQLRIPTLLVRGANSPAIHSSDLAEFLTDIPHAQIHTVPHAGHLVARDQPDSLLRTLISFLTQTAVSFRLTEGAA